MMTVHYDSLDINRGVVLDYPLREGVGTLYTRDVSKLRQPITMVSAPAWTTLTSGLPVLTLDGALDYLWTPDTDCTELDFTSEDYSLGMFVKFASGGSDDMTLMSRFLLDNHGWELYLYNKILSLRHHHAATLVGGNPRSSCYSLGWEFDTWYLMGISRKGTVGTFYWGDATGLVALATTHSAGGLVDSETSDGNFFIGNEPTGTNLLKSLFWRPKIWSGRALTLADWQSIWKRHIRWFLPEY